MEAECPERGLGRALCRAAYTMEPSLTDVMSPEGNETQQIKGHNLYFRGILELCNMGRVEEP